MTSTTSVSSAFKRELAQALPYYELHLQENERWLLCDRRDADIEAVDDFETLDEALLYIENDRAERKSHASS